ncbi:MAG: redox-regulated ATPase YchF [Acidobacteria bacterium]|nr:MAG: redox-regulated ATPase YchF [Acidobacteriota bacterium]
MAHATLPSRAGGSMDIGILGLSASGKSTLFTLLTGQAPDARHDAVTTGMATVPDERLDRLSKLFNPKKHTPATIRYVDVPGIPAEHGREGSLNISELRTMDVLMVVVRAFESDVVPHPLLTVNPVRDLERIDEEFILQDLLVVEKRLERLKKDLARKKVPELEREQKVLQKCHEILEDGRPLRSEDFSDNEEKEIRGFTFLSMKPLLVVVNLDESDVGTNPFEDSTWAALKDKPQMGFSSACATLEGEMADLDADDAAAFMEDLGLADRALDRIIRDSYHLLGLISFFTVGEDECRAWSIRRGTPAVEAAGAIHSDIQRGFIRAEVVPCEALLETGSLAECRNNATLRLEGKTYQVVDGDVVHYRFNV